MNVLSLFDGMSCGQIALERAGIKVDNYFASEIDKYAIQVTQKNFPNTKQIGSVTEVKGEDLPKIDLLIGGSPCQGFSFAGKQLNFEDPRSKLFFEFVRGLKETKPKYFFLENVKMKKEYQDIISEYLGCEPVIINSSLVSAQNRVRLYWTNIPNITQPKDKFILLKDVLEMDVSEKYFYTNEQKKKLQPSGTNQNKSIKIIAHRKGYRRNCQIFDSSGKTECIDTGQGGGRVIGTQIKKLGNVNPSGKGMNGEVYSIEGKSPTVTTNKGEGSKISLFEKENFRKLTPIECERLQTVPDNYTDCVSNSQRYKMLGNGWTVDVIAHIFKGIVKK